MRAFLAKTMVAALATVGLAAAAATATPASAAGFYHGGGGGWGGGGWRGGGWGGGWRGGGWGGGWRGGGWGGGGWGGGYWGGGYWGPGWGYAGWGIPAGDGAIPVGAGAWRRPPVVVGDVYADPNGGGCWVYRRAWSQPNRHGHYLGRVPVNVCQ